VAAVAAVAGTGRAPATGRPRQAARPGGGGAGPGRAVRSARRNPARSLVATPLRSRPPGRLQTRIPGRPRGCAVGGGRPPGAEISPKKPAARPP